MQSMTLFSVSLRLDDILSSFTMSLIWNVLSLSSSMGLLIPLFD